MPFAKFPLAVRSYSVEANEEEYDESGEATESMPAATPDELVRFEELSDAGVHPNLISAITQGMGYDTMTQVQAKTINSALKGTDM